MVSIPEAAKMIRFAISKEQADLLISKGFEGGWFPLNRDPEMFITHTKNVRSVEGALNVSVVAYEPIKGHPSIFVGRVEANKLPTNLPYELGDWQDAPTFPFIDVLKRVVEKHGAFRVSVPKAVQLPTSMIQDDKPTFYFNTGWLYVPADSMPRKVSLFGNLVESIQFRETGVGIPLFDETTGVTWGEIQKKTCVVFFNPFNTIDPVGGDAFIEGIFDAIYEAFKKSPEEEKARIADIKKRASVKRIKDIMVRENTKVYEAKKKEVKDLTASLEELYTMCGKKGATLRELNEQMVSMGSRLEKIETDAEQYLLEIEKFANVESLEFSPEGALVVNTRMLTCEHPNTHVRHMMGKFRIEFSFGEKWGIKFFNRTLVARPGDKQAPHVYQDGRPCFGNSEAVFSQYFAEGRIVDVIEYALLLPQSVTPNDAFGKYLYAWPLWKGTEEHRVVSIAGSATEISVGETFGEAYAHTIQSDRTAPSEYEATYANGDIKKRKKNDLVTIDVVSFVAK